MRAERYTSIPTTIDAIQWTGDNHYAVRAFTGMHTVEDGGIGNHMVFTTQDGPGELYVAANKAWLPLEEGEWIIKDALGFYPCKDSVFRAKYRKAD